MNMYTTVITETGSDTTIDLYMNGVLVGTMTAAKTMASFAMTQNLYLGAGNINGTPGYFLSGSLDDVMIFNKALTQAEIAALYGIGFTKQKQNQYSFRRHNQ